jgi:hypothetical protein
MRLAPWIGGWTAVAIAALGLPGSAAAQSEPFFAGKTLRIMVGLEAGGTADVFARGFAIHLKKHIPGNPTIVVQNMPSAGGNSAVNYLAERAAPDGLTFVFNPFHPLAQAFHDPALRTSYDKLDYVGAIGDIRVDYMRTDTVPGGMKRPSDIMRAEMVIVGQQSSTDFSGTLAHLALQVLGVKNRRITGYRGGADIFLAMQRGEIQYHNTSIGTFRTRSGAFVRAGTGIGVAYHVPVDANGHYERSKFVTEMPAFPDLYKEIHGKMPSGTTWDAFNWLINQVGEMSFIALAPPNTAAEPLAALRLGFERASSDPEFIKESVARNGVAYSYVSVARGQAIIRSLAEVTPEVLTTLRTAIGMAN